MRRQISILFYLAVVVVIQIWRQYYFVENSKEETLIAGHSHDVFNSINRLQHNFNGTRNFEETWNIGPDGWPFVLNCEAMMHNKTRRAAIDEYVLEGRVTINATHSQKKKIKTRAYNEQILPMDCTSIRARMAKKVNFTVKNTFAIARNIYSDGGYNFQEILLAMDYSERNSYCYAMDEKSDPVYKEKMRKLASCFSNVVVLDNEFPMDSAGHYQDHAHLTCVGKLLTMGNWKYVLFLQNHDIMLRTNYEMSQLIDVLYGAPLMENTYMPPHITLDPKFNWSVRSLKFWKHPRKMSKRQRDAVFKVTKSFNQVFLPKAFVESLIKYANWTGIADAFNEQKYGGDELMVATILRTPELDLPNQVQNNCTQAPYYVRLAHWRHTATEMCAQSLVRHAVCMLSVEFLEKLNRSHYICANKILPSFDYGCFLCWLRTFNIRRKSGFTIDLTPYKMLPEVREAKLKHEGKFDPFNFECHPEKYGPYFQC